MSAAPTPVWPSNEIERLFQAAVSDVSARPTLEWSILSADLFFIVEGENLPEGRISLQEGTRVGLRMMQDGDGTTALPAFTSLALLTAALKGEEVRYAVMRGADLFTMTRGTRVLVNPFGPYGKQFFSEEIERLLAGGTSSDGPTELHAGTQVLLGQLAEKPEDLMKAISEALAKEPAVTAAYIAAMAAPGSDSSLHPIVGIACGSGYEGVRDRLAPVLSSWARSTNRTVDLFDMAAESPITQHLSESHRFYPASRLRRLFGR